MTNRLSRRPFLQQSALAIASIAAGARTIRAQQASEERFGRWPIGIQSYSLRKFSLEEALRHVQALKLQHIEFYGNHYAVDSSDEQIETMNRALKKAGAKVNAHGVNSFTKDHEANRKVFEFAKRAGFKNITANPEPDSFESLDKLVEQYGIRICIHNHGPGALYDTLKDVQKAVSGHHPLVGVCIDTGHVLRSGENPVDWVNGLGNRVFALHLKDVEKQQKRTHDVILGTGHLPMQELFQALAKNDFPQDGSMSIEYESSPDNPIDDIQQCLTVVEDTIAAQKA